MSSLLLNLNIFSLGSDKLVQNTEYRAETKFFDMFFSKTPCETNGFKAFDYEKVCAMVLFFAHKNKELLKTKLMKLLHYSDMLFYKQKFKQRE